MQVKPIYEIGPVVAYNTTKTHRVIIGLIVAWLLLASAFSWLVIRENFGLKSCQVEQLSVITPQPINYDAAKSERHLQLAERIHKLYQVPLTEAQSIVTAVAMNADKVFHEALILAVIAKESSFDTSAKSDANAHGLLQVTYQSGKKVTLETFGNVTSGVELLKEYYLKLGSVDAALQAYNLGIGNYLKGQRAPEYLATVKRKVKQFVL